MLQNDALPELRNPILVAAFEGWNDAGESASETLRHLAEVWGAEPVASVDPDDFYDFQVNRPRVVRVDGQGVLRWPSTQVFLARPPGLDRDVLLVIGVEPSTRWRAFTEEILDLAVEAGVSTVLTLGGLLADVAHTRSFPVTMTSSDPAMRRAFDVEDSTYEGPTGIIGVMTAMAAEEGMATLSAWVAVPHYAGGAPIPKGTLALLSSVEEVLDVVVPRGDLEEMARAWERGVNELAESDEEVAEYVQALEEAQDAADLPEASGESLAREFERYLRAREDDDGKGKGR